MLLRLNGMNLKPVSDRIRMIRGVQRLKFHYMVVQRWYFIRACISVMFERNANLCDSLSNGNNGFEPEGNLSWPHNSYALNIPLQSSLGLSSVLIDLYRVQLSDWYCSILWTCSNMTWWHIFVGARLVIMTSWWLPVLRRVVNGISGGGDTVGGGCSGLEEWGKGVSGGVPLTSSGGASFLWQAVDERQTTIFL